MKRLTNQKRVEKLRAGTAYDTSGRVRERYFALRSVPVLLAWAHRGEGFLLLLREDPAV